MDGLDDHTKRVWFRAKCLKDCGKLDEAEPLYREALEGFRATLGDRQLDTLR